MADKPLNDGSEPLIKCPAEEGPSSGEWVDHEPWFLDLTDEEISKGNELGRTIDVDDDEDNGLGDAS